jgi:ribosome maturation factor RimP
VPTFSFDQARRLSGMDQRMQELEEKVERLIEPLVNEEGLKLVAVEAQRRGRKMLISVCLDREGGIDLDTCSRMSEEIGRYLDVEDLIDGSYDLEVCSPGLERVLKRPREFACFCGRRLAVWLKQPYEGRRKLEGLLVSASPQGLVLLAEGEELSLAYEALAKAKLVFDWKEDLKADKTAGDAQG